jgi:hypothetical protein
VYAELLREAYFRLGCLCGLRNVRSMVEPSKFAEIVTSAIPIWFARPIGTRASLGPLEIYVSFRSRPLSRLARLGPLCQLYPSFPGEGYGANFGFVSFYYVCFTTFVSLVLQPSSPNLLHSIFQRSFLLSYVYLSLLD